MAQFRSKRDWTRNEMERPKGEARDGPNPNHFPGGFQGSRTQALCGALGRRRQTQR